MGSGVLASEEAEPESEVEGRGGVTEEVKSIMLWVGEEGSMVVVCEGGGEEGSMVVVCEGGGEEGSMVVVCDG